MLIFIMIKIHAYTCLLSVVALSVVEMKILNINGRVGGSVTFTCSDWDVWTGVKYNDKYLCDHPCLADKHIIITAAFRKTTKNNTIELTNTENGLSVTFNNLQKSDSKIYYCGVERTGPDPLIEVNLKVTDASSAKTTPRTVNSVFSYMTLSTPTASATQGSGYVPYLIGGLIFTITVVMVGLILTRKMMKKPQQMLLSTPQEETRESAHPDEVYQSLDTLTMDKDQVYSTLTPNKRIAGPDEVYQSLDTLAMDKDQVYSTLPPTLRNAAVESKSMDTSSGS